MKTYRLPAAELDKINALSTRDVIAALNLATLNRHGVKGEFLPEFDARIEALEARLEGARFGCSCDTHGACYLHAAKGGR